MQLLIICQSDLPWLIPKGTTDANIDRIPPAIIYVSEKQVGLDICESLRKLLPQNLHRRPPLPDPPEYGFDVRSPAEKTIAVYYSDFSITLKESIHEQFVSVEARMSRLMHTLSAELEIDVYGREKLETEAIGSDIVSVLHTTFIDGFGVFRNVYRSLTGIHFMAASLKRTFGFALRTASKLVSFLIISKQAGSFN